MFLTLYVAAACLALVAAVYLLFRRGNAVAGSEVSPSPVLRRWTAALMAAIVASHVWWCTLGVVWLTDDRLVRNITAILLDYMTLVPLTMAVLLRMLQDRQRPVWLWLLVQVPVVVFGVMGLAGRDWLYGYTLPHLWQLGTVVVFIIYYALALRHYGRWLRDNYADLEHKEVWQSLAFALGLFVVYEVYTSNGGELVREYLSQVITLIIVAFLVWRVETLQELRDEWGGVKRRDARDPRGVRNSRRAPGGGENPVETVNEDLVGRFYAVNTHSGTSLGLPTP